MKLKKIFICLDLLIALMGCTSPQEAYFSLNKTSENELSYQFETYGLKSLNVKCVKYINSEVENTIPLGGVVYHQSVQDDGIIHFRYMSSSYDKKVVMLRINSQHFKSVGDTKILSVDMDLSQYDVDVLISELQVDEPKENLQLIEFSQTNHPEDKYIIELDIDI